MSVEFTQLNPFFFCSFLLFFFLSFFLCKQIFLKSKTAPAAMVLSDVECGDFLIGSCL